MVVRSPCQENYPADALPSAHKSVLESANPAWTRSVHLDAPGQRHGQQPVSGTADPGVIKQDKSSRGSVDTTKTRSYPQRVRMCSGERPTGAAKGKPTNTMALPPPPPPSRSPSLRVSCLGDRLITYYSPALNAMPVPWGLAFHRLPHLHKTPALCRWELHIPLSTLWRPQSPSRPTSSRRIRPHRAATTMQTVR